MTAQERAGEMRTPRLGADFIDAVEIEALEVVVLSSGFGPLIVFLDEPRFEAETEKLDRQRIGEST
jgi:hypothetical protein